MKTPESGGDGRHIQPFAPSDVAKPKTEPIHARGADAAEANTEPIFARGADAAEANTEPIFARGADAAEANTEPVHAKGADAAEANTEPVHAKGADAAEAYTEPVHAKGADAAEAYTEPVHAKGADAAEAYTEPVHAKGAAAAEAKPTSKADRVSPEWSERDERLLKWLIGPQQESLPNTRLDPSELKDIHVRLAELIKHFTETCTAEQLEAMKATLDETRKAGERIGRKDWLLLGIGALTTLAISAVFPPATVVHITKLFIHEVAHLYGEELAG